MNAAQCQQRLSAMKRGRRKYERAPHKPLLLLPTLGHVRRGSPRLRPYKDIEYELRKLLFDFGPPPPGVCCADSPLSRLRPAPLLCPFPEEGPAHGAIPSG